MFKIMAVKNDSIKNNLEDILISIAETKNIKTYEVIVNENVTKGDGFLSEFITGGVLNKDNGEITPVAIKKAPPKPINPTINNENLYTNELYFYSKLFPAFDKFQREKGVKYPFNEIPTFITVSAETKNMYIAMENLKNDGYVLYDKTKYFNKEHLAFIFKVYGKFHALSFNLQEQNTEEYKSLTGPVYDLFTDAFNTDEILDLLANICSNALKSFDPITEAETLARLKQIENIRDEFKDMLLYKSNYNCLTHGDCWSNNMLFKYKVTYTIS